MDSKNNHKDAAPKGILVKKEQAVMEFLIEAFPQNSRSSLKSFLQNRKVLVNGNVITKFNFQLRTGDVLSIVKATPVKRERLNGVTILFEDDHVLVIDKREGLLSIAGQNKDEETAFRVLSRHVKEEDDEGKIFIVHRLDRGTSGVMMYAKSQEVQEKMQRNWLDIVTERSYITVVEGLMEEEEGTIKSWLKEGKTFMVYSSFKDNGGQEAVLNYKKIREGKTYTMLEVSLDTGRKNQIRVQMQAVGHPVAGDKKYGAQTNPINRIALHAKTLSFIHPVSGKEMRFNVPTPKSFYELVKTKNKKEHPKG